MSKQVLKTVYEFNEVREKALEKNRDFLIDDFWYESIFEDFKEKLEKIGFENPEIFFSGFWSQGDGACFDADINIDKILNYLFENRYLSKKEIKQIKENIDTATIYKNHFTTYYSHEKTRVISISYNNYENENKEIFDKLQIILEDLRLSFCEKIYVALENEYERATSDEVLTDYFLNNDFLFEKDGIIYSY